METAYAWRRLVLSLLLSTIGGVGLWSAVVVLPAIQAEFGIARASASLPYTMTMVGFAFGGIATGRIADRFGIMLPVIGGTVALAIGYLAAAETTSLWQFAAGQGGIIALFGSSPTLGPLIADISPFFTRTRRTA